MTDFWDFNGPNNHRGPRCFEVPYALNNLKDGSVLEIGGNNSLFKWAIVRKRVKYTLIDPLGTYFVGAEELKEVTCLKGDIRKFSQKQLSLFDNILLISVLEHISLPSFNQKRDWDKYGSPRKAQLEAFKHCMRFLNKDGRMICTLPFGPAPKEDIDKKYESKDFLLRYERDMLDDLYNDYDLIDEKFFILTKPTKYRRWKEVVEEETKEHRANVCFILKHKQ